MEFVCADESVVASLLVIIAFGVVGLVLEFIWKSM